MLKLLTIVAILGSSFAYAGKESDAIEFVKKKLSQNRGVEILSVDVAQKIPVPGSKEWEAYVMEAELKLKRGNESREVGFETIIFVSDKFITTELIDRKSGVEVRSILHPKMPENIYSDSNLLFGESSAKHKLVLFSDPLCPFCRTYVPKVFEAAKKNPKNIALYYYHLPLSAMHPASDTLVKIMEIAKAKGNKSVIEQIYKIEIDPDLKDEKKITEIVEKKTGFKVTLEELNDKEVKRKIQEDRQMARKLLVTGTPTIFVDGKKDSTRQKYKSLVE